MKWFIKRLSEPSSAAAVSAVATAAGGALYAGMPVSVALPGIIGGVLAFLMPEKREG